MRLTFVVGVLLLSSTASAWRFGQGSIIPDENAEEGLGSKISSWFGGSVEKRENEAKRMDEEEGDEAKSDEVDNAKSNKADFRQAGEFGDCMEMCRKNGGHGCIINCRRKVEGDNAKSAHILVEKRENKAKRMDEEEGDEAKSEEVDNAKSNKADFRQADEFDDCVVRCQKNGGHSCIRSCLRKVEGDNAKSNKADFRQADEFNDCMTMCRKTFDKESCKKACHRKVRGDNAKSAHILVEKRENKAKRMDEEEGDEAKSEEVDNAKSNKADFRQADKFDDCMTTCMKFLKHLCTFCNIWKGYRGD